jgi:hypothetical protein
LLLPVGAQTSQLVDDFVRQTHVPRVKLDLLRGLALEELLRFIVFKEVFEDIRFRCHD